MTISTVISGNIAFDDEFRKSIKDLVKLMGSQSYIAELCGTQPSVISSIVNGRVNSTQELTYKRLSNLIGKSKQKIKSIEKELLQQVRQDYEAEKQKEMTRKAKLLIERRNRLKSLEIGKTYKVTFDFSVNGPKGKPEVLEGDLIEKYDRLLIFQSLNYKFSATVIDIFYGFVGIKEIGR